MKSPSLDLLNLFKGSLALQKVAAPTHSRSVSQACTQAQTEEPIIDEWYKKTRLQPAMHRKLWEFLYALQSPSVYDQIKVGMRAKGHRTALNFNVDDPPPDEPIDVPPYTDNPHRKRQFAEWSMTSFGLVVQKTTSG
ncbi:MAG: hypothetical protein AAGH57_02705 [Pseudomonadota bacterium]